MWNIQIPMNIHPQSPSHISYKASCAQHILSLKCCTQVSVKLYYSLCLEALLSSPANPYSLWRPLPLWRRVDFSPGWRGRCETGPGPGLYSGGIKNQDAFTLMSLSPSFTSITVLSYHFLLPLKTTVEKVPLPLLPSTCWVSFQEVSHGLSSSRTVKLLHSVSTSFPTDYFVSVRTP